MLQFKYFNKRNLRKTNYKISDSSSMLTQSFQDILASKTKFKLKPIFNKSKSINCKNYPCSFFF